MIPQSKPILFYDGVCGLCDGFIHWILNRDQSELFLFTPLQGQTAHDQGLIPDESEFKSIFLFHEGTLYQKSDAALKAIALLGKGYRFFKILLWIPKPVRDFFYDFVARNRYRWFGKKDVCSIPPKNLTKRFLP